MLSMFMFWSRLSQRDVVAAASVSLMSVMRLCMRRSLQYQLIVMFLFFPRLLSWFREAALCKQEEGDRRAWTSLQITGNCSQSLLILQWSEAAACTVTNNLRAAEATAAGGRARDKCAPFSMRANSFTQRLRHVFICEQQFHLGAFAAVSEIQYR